MNKGARKGLLPDKRSGAARANQAKNLKGKARLRPALLIPAILLVTALVFAATWWIDQREATDNRSAEIAVTVNGKSFDMAYFVAGLRAFTAGDLNTAKDYAPTLASVIQVNEVLRQGAASLGIGVSNEEVQAVLKQKNYPDEPVYRDLVAANLLRKKLEADYFPGKAFEDWLNGVKSKSTTENHVDQAKIDWAIKVVTRGGL